MYLNQDNNIRSVSNPFKGMNTVYDTTSNILDGFNLSRQTHLLEYLYRESWECRRVIDFHPDKMIRGWGYLGLSEENDQDLIEDTKDDFKKLKTLYNQGQKTGNLYGDAFVVRFVDDGRQIDEPIDYDNIKSVNYSRVFDYREVQPKFVEISYYDFNYYVPEYYYFYHVNTPYQTVHRDRMMRFSGDFIPPNSFEVNSHRYASILEPFITPYLNMKQSLHHIAEAMASFEVILFGVRGLFEDIIGGNDDQMGAAMKRYKDVQMGLSSMLGTVYDKDIESLDIAERKFTNVHNIISEVFRTELIGASGLTKTQMYNEHPAGLQATGKSQMLAEANRTIELQEIKWRDLIDQDTRIIMAKHGIQDGYNWHWQSIYQPTAEEETGIKKTTAETDKLYVDMGALTPEEVRQRFTGSEYQDELVVEENASIDMAQQKEETSTSNIDSVDNTGKFIPQGNMLYESDFAPIELEDLREIDDE